MSKSTTRHTVDLSTAHDSGAPHEVQISADEFYISQVGPGDHDARIHLGDPNADGEPAETGIFTADDGQPFGTVYVTNDAAGRSPSELVIMVRRGYCRSQEPAREVSVESTGADEGAPTLDTGQETNVPAAGTALNSGTSLTVAEVIVQADPGNTADVQVGNSTDQFMVLEPGNALTIPVDDVAKVFVAGSGSETVNWLARRWT